MRAIRHSEEALKVALISKSSALVKQYESLDPGERLLMNEAFRRDSILFRPITLQSASDWISAHPEPTQDFEEFYRDPYRKKPTPQSNTIYIQAIGSFGESRVSTEEYVTWLKGYCEAFYYGMTVKLLAPVPVSVTGCSFRVNDNTHNLQIHAGDLLRYLKRKKPSDAFCIVGITTIDLFPKESWNFVFGQASLTEGVGIFSFARYDSDFYSPNYKGRLKRPKKPSKGDYSIFDDCHTPAITGLLLLRSCKTLTHELGHIFGLRHCQWLACVMQGSNHLEESDRRPPGLCPICLRKLHCALGFSLARRYEALVRWIDEGAAVAPERAAKFRNKDPVDLPKPVEAFQEWREWILKCLAVLQKTLLALGKIPPGILLPVPGASNPCSTSLTCSAGPWTTNLQVSNIRQEGQTWHLNNRIGDFRKSVRK
uniref:Archaemetzincin-2 n=1 Tax=Ornithorhynchus anatinus TaxID=9258 RepID=A0A6I8ND01_ORNAN